VTETMVLEKVRAFITENFLYMRPDFRLTDEDRLLERRILDSMAVMELITFLKDEFGVSVPERDIREANLGSLKEIARYVVGARAGARGG